MVVDFQHDVAPCKCQPSLHCRGRGSHGCRPSSNPRVQHIAVQPACMSSLSIQSKWHSQVHNYCNVTAFVLAPTCQGSSGYLQKGHAPRKTSRNILALGLKKIGFFKRPHAVGTDVFGQLTNSPGDSPVWALIPQLTSMPYNKMSSCLVASDYAIERKDALSKVDGKCLLQRPGSIHNPIIALLIWSGNSH